MGEANNTACGMHLPGTGPDKPDCMATLLPFILEENVSFMKRI